MQLTDEQISAVEMVLNKDIGVITGGPGTGKTTVLRAVVQTLAKLERSCLLVAPTGRAAKRLSEVTKVPARTIHRFLATSGDDTSIDGAREEIKLSDYDYVIVDEASMVDAELAAKLLRNVDNSRVFFIGDVNQLPSIGPGRVLGDMIDSGRVPVARLTQVHRSKADSWVCQNAPLMLKGQLPDLVPAHDFEFHECSSTDDVVAKVRRLHAEYASGEVQVLTPQNKGGLGTHALNKVLQADQAKRNGFTIDPPSKNGVRHFREIGDDAYYLYDHVRHTKNNYDLNVFNGELGKIQEFQYGDTLRVQYDRLVEYNSSVAQDELSLAYAMTVHGAQGCEFDTVIMVVHEAHKFMLNRTLVYTAVTRAKQRVLLVGTRSALSAAVGNNNIQQRLTALRERITA